MKLSFVRTKVDGNSPKNGLLLVLVPLCGKNQESSLPPKKHSIPTKCDDALSSSHWRVRASKPASESVESVIYLSGRLPDRGAELSGLAVWWFDTRQLAACFQIMFALSNNGEVCDPVK